MEIYKIEIIKFRLVLARRAWRECVTYGVFDALNTQEEKSVSGVDIQNVQEQTQVEINEATKEADSSTSKVELNPSAEKRRRRKRVAPEDTEVIPVEVFLDTARVDVDGLVTSLGEQNPEQL